MDRSKSLQIVALTVILLGISNSPIFAVQEMEIGARDAGLGGAMTALADDTSALQYNPAGLVNLTQGELSSSYGIANTAVLGGNRTGDWAVNSGMPLGRKFGALGVSWRDVSE